MTTKLILTLAALALTITPTRGEELSLTGMWEANFKGAIFLRVDLTDGDSISGRLSIGSIAVDYEGNLLLAEPPSPYNYTPIRNPSFDERKLTFEIYDDGDITRVEITLIEPGKAEMRFPGLAQKIKPIVLEKK